MLLASLLVPALPLTPRPAHAAAPTAYVRPVTAGGVSEVVADVRRAYATNPSQNRVEVLSLATGAMEAPIAVGSAPAGLDLSADGARLYVTNADGNDVSVIDLALRREVLRIPLPGSAGSLFPRSIAVANNGMALVTTIGVDYRTQPTLLQIDLARQTVRERRDWGFNPEYLSPPRVRASGDRSRIGIVSADHGVAAANIYSATTDRFGEPRFLTQGQVLALDATGTTMVAGVDTVVLDDHLVVRATIPGALSQGLAMNSAATTAYRTREGRVEVIDVARALVTGFISFPGVSSLGSVALTPDNATLIVQTGGGIGVAPVGAAVPKPPCVVPSVPPSVIKVCGAPLADVVIDSRARAYASNPDRNEIEVVSLATRSLEAPIPVGSQPKSLDLSPDGSTLYVSNTGAEDISVVNLLIRREVRRVTLPRSQQVIDRPLSIAVADNGTGLLTTQVLAGIAGSRLLQFDLLTGAVRERTDQNPTYLKASGDHSRIVATPNGFRDPSVHLYVAATDTFSEGRGLGGTPMIAVDRTASRVLLGPGSEDNLNPANAVPVTYVLDGDLVRRATISDNGYGLGINSSGTTGYRIAYSSLEVVDLARGLIVASIPLPETVTTPRAMAISPDNAAAAVLTPGGMSVLALTSAHPVPPCIADTISPPLTAAPCDVLSDVVIDASGYAYASNPSRNQIEVVSIVTGAVEAPIPVGSRPRGLDLSPDGSTLYVADSGGQEISVVDLSQRRESHRITVPLPLARYEARPFSIAVGDHGIALFTTTTSGSGYGGHVMQIDLVHETVRVRSDFGGSPGSTTTRTLLKASGDRSHIAVVADGSWGPMTMYDSAADVFGTEHHVDASLSAVALDGPGARVLVGPGSFVLDGDLNQRALVPSGGTGLAVSADGATGYRVQDSSVDVIDLNRAVVVRTIPLPAPVGFAGGVALSPDSNTLAVLTRAGVTFVGTQTPMPQSPFTVWTQKASTPLDGIGAWMGILAHPTAAAGQVPPTYLYGHYFGFTSSSAQGVVGLGVQSGARYAAFAVVDPSGVQHAAVVPFNWAAGRYYYPYVRQLAPGTWGAWVFDNASGTWTAIGQLSLPSQWGKLAATTVTRAVWYGATATKCSAYPRAEVLFSAPTGFAGATVSTADPRTTGQSPGGCAARGSVEASGWARYRLGAVSASP